MVPTAEEDYQQDVKAIQSDGEGSTGDREGSGIDLLAAAAALDVIDAKDAIEEDRSPAWGFGEYEAAVTRSRRPEGCEPTLLERIVARAKAVISERKRGQTKRDRALENQAELNVGQDIMLAVAKSVTLSGDTENQSPSEGDAMEVDSSASKGMLAKAELTVDVLSPPSRLPTVDTRPVRQGSDEGAVDAFLTFVGSSSPMGVIDPNFTKTVSTSLAAVP